MSKSWLLVLALVGCGGAASSADRGPGGTSGGTAPGVAAPDDVDLGPAAPLGGDDPCPPLPLSLGDTLTAVLADVRAQPAADRPFLRYVSTAQFRAACSVPELDEASLLPLERARGAVSKLSNSLSHEPVAVVPAQMGPEGLLLRLDLRSYGWQRAVTVEGQSYGDAWEAIAARAGIALELQGGTASELSAELGTNVPILLASSFRGHRHAGGAVLRNPGPAGHAARAAAAARHRW